MAGRPRKPSALKILHGDFEINPERRNKKEPQPEGGRPVCPSRIKGVARREWKRICDLLSATGVLTVDCGPALEQYCTCYALWRKALADIEKRGLVIGRQKNPYANELREYGRDCHRWLTEFGLTPSSRTRIQIEQATDTAHGKAKKFGIG